MFTGIIEKTGCVLSNLQQNNTARLIIEATLENPQVGESIAIQGVCLTLLPSPKNQLCFDVSPETLRCTNLGNLQPGDGVNLERAMLASSRFGGHYVTGHVDTVTRVQTLRPVDEYLELTLGDFTTEERLYLIPKGSITVNGISLTINTIEDQRVKLMLIPHTLEQTTLASLYLKEVVNIEFDYLTRMVTHQLNFMKKLFNNDLNS